MRWFAVGVDESSLIEAAESNKRGRPLSERSAWAILAASALQASELDKYFNGESPVLRHHARKRIDALIRQVASIESGQDYADAVPSVAASLRRLLQNRAQRNIYRASPRDLPDLRAEKRLILSGLSHPNSGMASGDAVEAYVQRADLDGVVDDYSSTRGETATSYFTFWQEARQPWARQSRCWSPLTWPNTVAHVKRVEL